MPFLSLNGWTVPVTDAQVTPRVTGDRDRAFSGATLISQRAFRDDIKITTKPVSEMVGEALRGMIQGRGDVWTLSNTLYSGKGQGETGTAVKTFRSATGADGATVVDETPFDSGYSCAFEAGATNLFPANVRAASATTDFTAVGGGSVATNTDNKWQGSSCVAWTPGGQVDIGGASISASTEYTASCYLKGSRTVSVYWYDDDSGATTPVQYALSATQWTRVVATGTSNGAATALTMSVSSVSGSGDVYIDGCQAEAGALTSWVDGTRAADTAAAYVPPFASATSYTLACWVRAYDDPTADAVLVDVRADSTHRATLYHNSGGTLLGYVANGSTTSANQSSAIDGDWHHAALVCRAGPETGEYAVTLYYDGTMAQQTAFVSGVPEIDSTYTVSIGGVGTDSPAQAQIAGVVLLPYAAPAALVAAMAARTSDWPAPPKVELAGDVIAESTRDAVGIVDSDRRIAYNDGGAHRNNGRVLEATLEEV